MIQMHIYYRILNMFSFLGILSLKKKQQQKLQRIFNKSFFFYNPNIYT